MLPVLAIIFLGQMATSFSSEHDPLRSVDHVKITAWLVLSVVLLMGLATGGFWLRPRELRTLIDDETTRAHRSKAMSVAFLATMGACIVVYFYSWADPFDARHAIHIIMSVGIASGLLAFGFLERRAHRDA